MLVILLWSADVGKNAALGLNQQRRPDSAAEHVGWDEFVRMLDRPARDLPKLREAAKRGERLRSR